MKSRLSPLPYPTTKEEEFKWGFDVYKPEGTPSWGRSQEATLPTGHK